MRVPREEKGQDGARWLEFIFFGDEEIERDGSSSCKGSLIAVSGLGGSD